MHMLGMPKDSGVGISDSAGTNLRRGGGPYELGGALAILIRGYEVKCVQMFRPIDR